MQLSSSTDEDDESSNNLSHSKSWGSSDSDKGVFGVDDEDGVDGFDGDVSRDTQFVTICFCQRLFTDTVGANAP
jgi:hypothetical protein